MGYRPKRRIFNLDFTGTDYEGLEASMRGPTVGEEIEFEALQDKPGGAIEVFELMAGLLVSWNVEDDHGQPVPCTLDGVRTQDAAMVTAILKAAQTAASGVPAPLPSGSPSGEPSLVESIPMDALSPNPQNSAVPA